MGKMKATATNVGPTIMSAEVRGHRYFADLPEEMGGYDSAALPPEILCAALANCVGMVIAITCMEEDIPCVGMTVEVEAEEDEARKQLDNFSLTVRMPEALSDQQLEAVKRAPEESRVRGTIMHGASLNVMVTCPACD